MSPMLCKIWGYTWATQDVFLKRQTRCRDSSVYGSVASPMLYLLPPKFDTGTFCVEAVSKVICLTQEGRRPLDLKLA